MRKFFKILFIIFFALLALLFMAGFALSFKSTSPDIDYGVSFSKFHSDELKLPWKEVYLAVLDDLKVRRFRLSAHWPMIEPEKDVYSYDDLDYQIKEAEARNAKVILAVGRRLPGWPECHIPKWAVGLSWDEQKKEILAYMENTINRYKGSSAIKTWQVENEPFLSVFATEQCGPLDTEFLKEEIALVKKLDPTRPVLVTDSGNLGLWKDAWRAGDQFGTSVYLYLWNPTLGQVRTVYMPSFYRIKSNLMSVLFGDKKNVLIELSLEPWLLEPIVNAPVETGRQRMTIEKFNEAIEFAQHTGFNEQYLWGVEWWYFMKDYNHPEYWNTAKEIFSK